MHVLIESSRSARRVTTLFRQAIVPIIMAIEDNSKPRVNQVAQLCMNRHVGLPLWQIKGVRRGTLLGLLSRRRWQRQQGLRCREGGGNARRGLPTIYSSLL